MPHRLLRIKKKQFRNPSSHRSGDARPRDVVDETRVVKCREAGAVGAERGELFSIAAFGCRSRKGIVPICELARHRKHNDQTRLIDVRIPGKAFSINGRNWFECTRIMTGTKHRTIWRNYRARIKFVYPL